MIDELRRLARAAAGESQRVQAIYALADRPTPRSVAAAEGI